ncbi:MAG: polysaccharide biosynthesis protein [Candidatus Ruminococcus intestinipullorum]|nr:polysaccharide biosynthesis protein [Candidatus Ruminococcus intestinipullorum]
MTEIQKNNRKKRGSRESDFLIQGAILAAAAVIVKVIGALYRIPLTNIIGDEGNGFLGYAYEIYAMALMLSSFSLPIAVSKLVSTKMAMHQPQNAYRIFKCAMAFAITVGVTVALLIFLGADFLAKHLMESPLSVYTLRVLSPALLIVAVLGVMRGYFQGVGTMIPTALSQIMEQIINAVVNLAGASIMIKVGLAAAKKQDNPLLEPAFGAAGGTAGTAVGALVALLFLLFVYSMYRPVLRRQMRQDHTKKQDRYEQILKVLLLTIAPILFSTAIYNINQIIDLTLYAKIMSAQGIPLEEYLIPQGIYTGKYNTLINIPLAMANGLAASVIPALTTALASRNRTQMQSKINQTIRFTMLIAIPCFVAFIALASPIMVFLYGDDRMQPALMLASGAITVVLYSSSTVTNSILQGMDRLTVPARNAAISLGVHLVAVLIMLVVFKWGIYSLIFSNIVFSLCMCILNMKEVYRVSHFRQDIQTCYIKPTIAAVIMGVVAFLANRVLNGIFPGRFFANFLSFCIAAVVYAIAVIRVGTLSESDMLTLPMGSKLLHLCKKFHIFPVDKDIEYLDL